MTTLSLKEADILAIGSAVIRRETGDHGIVGIVRTWSRATGCPIIYIVAFTGNSGGYNLNCTRDELEPVVVDFPRRDTAPCELEPVA